MLTYHQVQGYLQKSAALSNDFQRLKELMMPVLRMFEIINRHNEELGKVGDEMRGEIRAVEILGEMLRRHVYNQTPKSDPQEEGVPIATPDEEELTGVTDQSGNWTKKPGDFVI